MITVTFDYINWKCEIKTRTVDVESVEFLFNPGFGYDAGWFLTGFDHEKQARRSFLLNNIIITADGSQKPFKLLELK